MDEDFWTIINSYYSDIVSEAREKLCTADNSDFCRLWRKVRPYWVIKWSLYPNLYCKEVTWNWHGTQLNDFDSAVYNTVNIYGKQVLYDKKMEMRYECFIRIKEACRFYKQKVFYKMS